MGLGGIIRDLSQKVDELYEETGGNTDTQDIVEKFELDSNIVDELSDVEIIRFDMEYTDGLEVVELYTCNITASDHNNANVLVDAIYDKYLCEYNTELQICRIQVNETAGLFEISDDGILSYAEKADMCYISNCDGHCEVTDKYDAVEQWKQFRSCYGDADEILFERVPNDTDIDKQIEAIMDYYTETEDNAWFNIHGFQIV